MAGENTIQTQYVREAPEIEAYKQALLQSSLAQVNAINAAAQQGRYLTPGYQIAGMSQNQLDAIAAAQAGIGAYQPYLSRGTEFLGQGAGMTGEAAGLMRGADTRGFFPEAYAAMRGAEAPISSMGGAAQGIGQAQQMVQGALQPIERVGTESFTQPGTAGQFMSPYMQQVVDIEKREAQRQADIARTQRGAQLARAGAFGGARQAIMEAEAQRNLSQQMGDIQSRGMQSAYQQAQQQFNQEQQARLAAQQANQAAGLTRGQMGIQAGSQYGQLAGQQANIYGQQAALRQQLGQGIGALAGQQFGIGSQLAQGMGALGAQQAGMGLQAANLGQMSQALGQGDVGFLYNMGSMQQRQQQAILDAQRQNQLAQNMQPLQMLGFLSDIYKGAPSTQMAVTQQSMPTASPFQQIAGLGIGATAAAAAAGKAGLFSP